MTKSRASELAPPPVGHLAAAAAARGARALQAADDDTFFRHIVGGMRNGVLAMPATAAGADQRRGVPRLRDHAAAGRHRQPGRRRARDHPDIVRVLTGVFDLHLLPNRVEMRRSPGQVIGYTLAHVRDDTGE